MTKQLKLVTQMENMNEVSVCKLILSIYRELEGRWQVRMRGKSEVVKYLHERLSTSTNMTEFLVNLIQHDLNTFVHSVNVSFYSFLISEGAQFSQKEQKEVVYGALLHDVGKVLIPIQTLNKKEKLQDWEFNLIKEHASKGGSMLKKEKTAPKHLIEVAEQHHEHIDGNGYPKQLKGHQIHKYAKVVAVADVFDALTTDRPYRKAIAEATAFEIVKKGINQQFEELYAKILLNTFEYRVCKR